MAVLTEIRRRARQITIPVIGACVLGYFAYHTVQGDRGLLSYWRMSQEVNRAETTLAAIQEHREVLERRVSLLRAKGLDLDMLDQQARLLFNLLDRNDLMIFLPVPDSE
ncbi:MAG: septum formation initiator family protein [Alphaproteobacteria bacterium]